VGVEATHDEVIQVVLERVSNVLGRPLVEGQNNQTISLAVQNLRRPRLYMNGVLLNQTHQFQDMGMVNGGEYTLLCDCRPCFPLLTQCRCAQVGVTKDNPPGRIVQLTTVAGTNPPYKYQFVKTLANAIYGKVKSCVKLHLRDDGTYTANQPYEMFACKIMFKNRMTFYNPNATIFSEDPMMELATQQFLGSCNGGHHSNVCGLVECCEDQGNIFAIMPFSDGGDLLSYTCCSRATTHAGRACSCIPEDHARGIFRQIVEGTSHMHSCFIVHSDLTLENVMIERGNPVVAKIIDFGMSKHVLPKTDGTNGSHMLPPLRGGKVFYLAPEIWQERPYRYDGYLADIWSIGVILINMITGETIIDRANDQCARFNMICKGKILDMLNQWRNEVPTLTASAQDLITRILIPE
jgi:serine/threonine protein kinase